MVDEKLVLEYYTRGNIHYTKDKLPLWKYSKTIGSFTVTLLQQNKYTGSRWAQLAIDGKDVIQVFVDGGFYGVFVDGDLTVY